MSINADTVVGYVFVLPQLPPSAMETLCGWANKAGCSATCLDDDPSCEWSFIFIPVRRDHDLKLEVDSFAQSCFELDFIKAIPADNRIVEALPLTINGVLEGGSEEFDGIDDAIISARAIVSFVRACEAEMERSMIMRLPN